MGLVKNQDIEKAIRYFTGYKEGPLEVLHIQSLRVLKLEGTPERIIELGLLEDLKGMIHLETLILKFCHIESLEVLNSLTTLRTVELISCDLDDESTLKESVRIQYS